MKIGIATQGKAGQTHCGDAGGYWIDGARTLLCLVDGLGHGEHAQVAAEAALAAVAQVQTQPLADILDYCDRQLRSTRGVAMGLARIDTVGGRVDYVGVGNIRALRVGSMQRRFVTSYGIVGGGFGKLFQDEQPFGGDDSLLMFTDGIEEIGAPGDLCDVPGIDPQVLARRLLETFADGQDDAAVLICRF